MKHDHRTDNEYTGITGKPAFPVCREADHYYVCEHCGQAVDMRDLGQVFHHEAADHKPLEAA